MVGEEEKENEKKKKNKKNNNNKRFPKGSRRETTYLVTNLLVNCCSENRWYHFKEYGRISDAYVPANISRQSNHAQWTQAYVISRPPIHANEVRSFRDAVVGNSRSGKLDLAKKSIKINHKSAWFPETHRKKAVVAGAFSLEGLANAKAVLEGSGIRFEKISYIGGMKVLISFFNAQEAKNFIELNVASWRNVFSSVVIWDGQEIEVERIVGVNIYGVPLLLRDEATYNKIGRCFILTSLGSKICEEVQVCSKNKTLLVWVREDQSHWAPSYSSFSKVEDDDWEFDGIVEHEVIGNPDSPVFIVGQDPFPVASEVDSHGERLGFKSNVTCNGLPRCVSGVERVDLFAYGIQKVFRFPIAFRTQIHVAEAVGP
ncbi:hypothetical protein QVD17_29184 [Tagetes erecta]|uniref:Uncharacterized protein n=1 Tax=Tagetes erecta TaxID=13708 RepID=A0AAD8NSM8_TARER|nr:hypothetical protein QVD17_29184 [Tagetes erecta]